MGGSLAWTCPTLSRGLGRAVLLHFVFFPGNLWATRGSSYKPGPQGVRISLPTPILVPSGTARDMDRSPLQASLLLHKLFLPPRTAIIPL